MKEQIKVNYFEELIPIIQKLHIPSCYSAFYVPQIFMFSCKLKEGTR
ncbi:MAG: hypothetical protein PHY47_20160 [Lachnospiraceae bacterium]|nr:hypothetical protein [Lachnospiraceae bacterium]